MIESLYTRAAAGILFPLHEFVKGHDTVALRKELEETQWWPVERLRELQGRRLRELLVASAACVPYYRSLFSTLHVSPGELHSIDSLSQLPFLTKDNIRAHVADLRSEQARGLIRLNTGGSTGQPLAFYVGRHRVSHDVAAKWRATRWWSVDIGDSEVVLWGSPIEIGAQDRLRAFRDFVFRSKLVSSFDLSEEALAQTLRYIRRRRPKMLFGYPSALARVAAFAQERHIRVDDLGIRVAFVTAERLYDDQRQIIAATFGCVVANGYGGRDAGFVAHECPAGGLHLSAEDVIVEIVLPDGSPAPTGCPGEIVVTHLASADFPFIRYRTGDIGAMSPNGCPCGRGLPVLSQVEGRVTDFVVTQYGVPMHGLALIYVLREMQGVSEFKLIQETPLWLRVLLVPSREFHDGIPGLISAGIKKRLGPDVNVEITRVDAIAPEASGKYRYVISKVSQAETQAGRARDERGMAPLPGG